MRYAEIGYNLEIDLATGNIERVETDPKMTELHLGGGVPASRYTTIECPPRQNHSMMTTC